MDLWLGKSRLRLSGADEIGSGGEARVFRHKDLAIKIFELDLARTKAKAEKLRAFPAGLPASVVQPLELVRDRAGAVVGYAMRRIDGAQPLFRYAQRSWREGVASNAEVLGLFRALAQTIGALHARGVVVGDLNDGNVLCDATPWLIDVDSMQFGTFPCTVAHERFLDPRLYGRDLEKDPALSTESDWYAFAVALFSSLLYVHPYGGVAPGLPTMLRRAEARHSLLRPDVTLPRAAVTPKILGDPLRDWFEAVFEKDARTAPPAGVLDSSWTRCACGLEHARLSCPACSRARPAMILPKGLRAHEVLRTPGRVLACVWQGAPRFLYAHAGRLFRETGELPVSMPGRVARFAISGGDTWIAEGGTVTRWSREGTERVMASAFDGAPMFAASSAGVVFAQGDWLVGRDGARLGRILEGRTWLALGERFGLGWSRAGRLSLAFLFTPSRAGLREVQLPAFDGRVIDLSCTFDARHALLAIATEHRGRYTTSLHLIADDGRVLASRAGDPLTDPILASVRGKAVLDGRVVCATDDGLVALRPNGAGGFDEVARFSTAREHAAPDDTLIALPGGELLAVAPHQILRLSP
jgi:hypothetical protein